MAYLTEEKLKIMGFISLGSDVKISDKAVIYNPEKMSIGNHSRIDDFCIISGKVSIGDYVHITPQCLIAGGDPGILMDDYSTLSYGVKAFSQSDDYSGESMTNSLIPKKFKKERFASINFGRFSIVGAGSVIMPGANIAEGVSIGAMSLVLRPTLDWKVYAGVPAKEIKDRSRQLLNLYGQFRDSKNDTF